MKCLRCEGNITKRTGVIEFNSKNLGIVRVPNIVHKKCDSCGDVLIPSGQSKKILEFVKKQETRVIRRIPFDDFVSLNEAAEILNVTKQALSKNPKIKNGLIYSAMIGDRRYYVRKSVETFKETGNGKYPLGIRGVYERARQSDSNTLLKQWVKQIPSRLPVENTAWAGTPRKKTRKPKFPSGPAIKHFERIQHYGR